MINVKFVHTQRYNWLYKDVNPDSVDDATKKVINNPSAEMLEKETKDEIAGFQLYQKYQQQIIH